MDHLLSIQKIPFYGLMNRIKCRYKLLVLMLTTMRDFGDRPPAYQLITGSWKLEAEILYRTTER